MIYVKSIRIKLSGSYQIKDDFELGDLTIFIGRSNCGKTRILNFINQQFNEVYSIPQNQQGFSNFENACKERGIVINSGIGKSFRAIPIPHLRNPVDSIHALGLQLAKSAISAKIIDPSIDDFGTNQVRFINEDTRTLQEQGSGLQNIVQILNRLFGIGEIFLIDEPEVSQFPHGKIEIIRNIIESLDRKQVIIATHDPTIINQYLIKKISGGRNLKVVIHSFSGNKFHKIDFSSNLDPEIHVGYLSQTYSGKPVHLILEGQTEYYLFQALLFKYSLAKKIKQFPRLINKISLSYLAGEKWEANLNHLPDTRFFSVAIMLDGEYSKRVKEVVESNSTKFAEPIVIDNFSEDKINIITLSKKNIEEVFGEKLDKPIGLSEKIWSLSDDEILKLEGTNNDMKMIFDLIRWSINKAKES